MQRISANAVSLYGNILNGIQGRVRRRSYINQDNRINEMNVNLRVNRINHGEFLQLGSNHFQPLLEREQTVINRMFKVCLCNYIY